jgi:predicted helicase
LFLIHSIFNGQAARAAQNASRARTKVRCPLWRFSRTYQKVQPFKMLVYFAKSLKRFICQNTAFGGLNYKLSQRSPLEWIIDQYKLKKIEDPTVAEQFNIYSHSDYKQEIISLIKKITTVSLETVKISGLMKNEWNIE